MLGGGGGAVVACARCGFVPTRPAGGHAGSAGGPGAAAASATVEQVLEVVGGYIVRGDDLLDVGEHGKVVARLAPE